MQALIAVRFRDAKSFHTAQGRTAPAPVRAVLIRIVAVSAIALQAGPAGHAQSAAEFFEAHVRPLLVEKCFSCHTQTKMGGLEMTSREALLRGGQSGPAVEPRAPERSLLVRAVRYSDERLQMPPTGQLSKEEIKILTKWVEDGAAWPATEPIMSEAEGGKLVIADHHRDFWAFRPVADAGPPPGRGSAIDRFINARLEEAGIALAPPADKPTLIRRAYYDLVGLPPSPEEVTAFLADASVGAFASVVDRLLASSRYGERWGRHWLDVARYSDDRLNSTQDEPYPNAWRYRDWVIAAFNADMPYDLFVKAQIAADQLDSREMGRWAREDLVAGLGLFALSPKFQDDRIDVTGRGFMALTIGCAQCHDHKFDPIPTEDYYALLGVFNSTEPYEHPLAAEKVVQSYQGERKRADEAKARLQEFLDDQSGQLVDALAAQTKAYILAAWSVAGPDGSPLAATAADRNLDPETLERWVDYLAGWPKQHPLVDDWKTLAAEGGPLAGVKRFAETVEAKILHLIAEKKRIEDENEIRLGGDRSGTNIRRTALLALPRDEFYLWSDLASPNSRDLPSPAKTGVLYYKDDKLDRFLSGVWKDHVVRSRAAIADLEARVPAKYPFLHTLQDKDAPSNEHVHIRGSRDALGEEVPRRFLRILSEGEPEHFTSGSGRLDLARAVASPDNPLTARVMVNRIWMHHFGRGIVATPSNFGMMGERPTHPELLDYLAARFVDSGWSLKALHREILLTDAYRRSSRGPAASEGADPDNRLLWRSNRRRLDAESLLDSMLLLSGRLAAESGGPPRPWDDRAIRSRTVYRFVSRRRLDVRLGLFDFPNPNQTSPRRFGTNTPLQGLFFLNSSLVIDLANSLSERLETQAGAGADERIRRGYELVYGRQPTDEELALNRQYVDGSDGDWPGLMQAWLSSNEFLYVN